MASNTTSSIYGSGISSNRVTGLFSGLDTDDLVKQLSQSTQIKINRQFQAQQKLVYKQDAFREVISKLVSFSDKYLTATSKTNILSSSFFKANTVKASSSNVTVSGDMEALKNFTIDSIDSVASAARFTSNKAVSSGEIESKVFNTTGEFNALAGQSMTFQSVSNGKTTNYTIKIDPNFEFKSADPAERLNEIKDELNNQINKHSALKNNKVNYEVVGNQLKLNTGDFGDAALKVSAVGDEINSRLKIDVDSILSGEINPAETFLKTVSLKDVLSSGKMTFDYNGVQKTISFPDAESTDAIDTVEKLEEYLQNKLNSMYGTGKVQVDVSSGKLTFKTSGANNLFGITSVSQDISKYTGLSAGSYNRVNKDIAIENAKIDGLEAHDTYELEINNVKFSFSKDKSLNDIIKEINASSAGITITHSSTTDKLTVVAKETGSHIDINIEDKVGNLAESIFGVKDDADNGYTVNKGLDTVITVTKNGVQEALTRSTTNISFDGINLGLTNKAKEDIDNNGQITFTVSEETDKVVEKMAKFVEDYNEIVTYLDKVIRQRPNRDYLPLTDEQRREMSESEIKLWDEKAKEGMLYQDSDLSSLLYSWKESLSGFVEGNGLHLSNIGISAASGDYTGKLVFDEDKFRNAYAKDADKIAQLFTNNPKNATASQKGLAQRLKEVVTRNVGVIGEKGILVEKAGTKGTSSEKNNFLYERIKEYDELISKLKTKLKAEQEKYYAQFSALEKALANMNSQSSWLSSQFS